MKGLSTRVYLATGLAFLVASILLAAAFFGLLPDRGAALREGRTALAELAAVTSAAAVEPERVPRVQATLAFMLERNKDLVSVAVRRKDGAIVVSAGDHFAHWQPLVDDRSTDTQIQVPISANRERWGQLELKFRPTGVPSLFGMEMPWLYLAAYMLFGSLVAFYFYLGRVLRHLDPSQAVPGRVRAALDTLAEGLVVIDKKQSIVLANQAFASLLGATSEALLGKPPSGGSRPTARRSRKTSSPGSPRCARAPSSATASCICPTRTGSCTCSTPTARRWPAATARPAAC
jgi:PAS domain-containing protein